MKYLPTLTFLLLAPSIFAQTFERFRCIWNNDPATTMTIGYEGSTAGQVYYDVVDHGTTVTNYSFSQVPSRSLSAKGMDNHFVRLVGLQPDTKYYFVVSDNGAGTSQRFWFKTAADSHDTRLSFMVGGDSRNTFFSPNNYGPRVNANEAVAKLRPDAVLFGGDMTLFDFNNEWRGWLNDWQQTIAADGRMTPIIPARGNHEYDADVIYELFDTSSPDSYYALSFGNDLLRVYTLNSLISVTGNQAGWLETDLAENACHYWKIAQYHYPTRPTTTEKDDKNDQRDAWSRKFDTYGMGLVCESDAHICKYTYPILVSDDNTATGYDEGFVRDDFYGVTYIGEGGWGAETRDADDAKAWTADLGSFNQVKWVFVDKNTIEVRTILTDNVDNIPAKTEADSKFTIPTGNYLWNAAATGTVLVLDKPRIPTSIDLGTDQVLCDGCIMTLDAGAGYFSYLWSTGEITQSINVSSLGNYSVTVTNSATCAAYDHIEIIAPLPIDLIRFSGTRVGNGNVLNWETASETENAYFQIQTSKDTDAWVVIGEVQGQGTSSAQHFYRFVDEEPFAALTYYRLRQVDVDGTSSYSPVIAVSNRNLAAMEVISLAPNPTEGVIHIEFLLETEAQSTYQVMDIKGKAVMAGPVSAAVGLNRLEVDTRGLAGGIYFFILRQGNRQVVRKFLKN